MKKWLKITLGLLLVIATGTLLAFVSSQPKEISCYDVQVKIKGDPEAMFVSEQEILDRFETICSDRPSKETIDLKEIEKSILQISSVKKANVFKSVNGAINIEVELKTVIGRVINKSGNSFYIDADGAMMPIVDAKPARVCVVNGEILEEYNADSYYLKNDSLAAKSVMDDVNRMLQFISKDEFWKAQIEQMYVTPEKKFILIPKVGMHEIMFGEADHIEGKFKKLELFYQSGVDRVGWEKYSMIDVQYKGQVVGIGQEAAIIPVAADTAEVEIVDNNNGQTEQQ
jgi:cell division protein FtsQ